MKERTQIKGIVDFFERIILTEGNDFFGDNWQKEGFKNMKGLATIFFFFFFF